MPSLIKVETISTVTIIYFSRSAIAVGRACISGTRMLLNVAKGASLVTKHHYGDQLWYVLLL